MADTAPGAVHAPETATTATRPSGGQPGPEVPAIERALLLLAGDHGRSAPPVVPDSADAAAALPGGGEPLAPVGRARPGVDVRRAVTSPDLLALQRLAGNRAVDRWVHRGTRPVPLVQTTRIVQPGARPAPVVAVVQRDPTVQPPAAPRKPRGATIPSEPLELSGDLPATVAAMPSLLKSLSAPARTIKKGRMADVAGGEELRTVSAATLWARDAVYRFSGDGMLMEVQSNLSAPIDPQRPDDIPPPASWMPSRSSVVVVEPATKRAWQVHIGYAKTAYLLLVPHTTGGMRFPEAMDRGDLIVFLYAPASLASEDGGPQPGFKGKAGEGKPEGPPPWAKRQQQQISRALANIKAAEKAGGTGTGLEGSGLGGGGTALEGQGTGTSGTGVGAADKKGGRGRGGDRQGKGRGHRANPDKVVVWQGKRGPMLNVWVGSSVEAIPLKQGESDAALMDRVQQAAGRQTSTGKRLANGATITGFAGGKSGGLPTAADLADATSTNANARAYPSRIEMQGGSGSEVSPKGWATTVTGGDHDFDMRLDWDAITFGFSNQVFSRLAWISYYWQVVKVSGTDLEQGARAKATDAAKTEGNIREPGALEGVKAKVGRTVKQKLEDIEADLGPEPGSEDALWEGRASDYAIMAVDFTWSVLKSLVAAWIAKILEPENRQNISFAEPGEYVVRCLANPIERDDIPEEQRTRRATSIAAFPVRVIDLDKRAAEVNRDEQRQIVAYTREVARAEAELAANKDDPGKVAALALAQMKLLAAQGESTKSTTEKLDGEAQAMRDELTALAHLIKHDGDYKELKGAPLVAAMRITKTEKQWAKWQWQNRETDLKKALEVKTKQQATAKDWTAEKLGPGERLRPRVTFVSEENGAIIRMTMILGQADDSTAANPKWTLLDLTSPKTQGHYTGASAVPGPIGHVQAITAAFTEFAEKAEYGRGTLAIDLPGSSMLRGAPAKVPQAMLMKPGALGRWRGRLQSLVEIASLVAPFTGGPIGTFAMIGGALESGYRLYDRARNDRLKADFETLTDIIGVLGPFIHGSRALSELDSLARTKTGYVFRVAARVGDLANDFMVPLSVMHDIELVIRDTQMGKPEKQAAVAMILGRAARDKLVQHLGGQYQAGKRARGTADEPIPTRRPHEEPGPTRPHDETGPTPRPDGTAGVGTGGPKPPAGHDAPPTSGIPGMPANTVVTLTEFAKVYHVTIDVRPPGSHTDRRLATGAVPKPEIIKAKTINAYDVFLGAPANAMGLVGYFEPRRPARPRGMQDGEWSAILERHDQRLREYRDLRPEMTQLQADRTVRVTDGVVRILEPRGPQGGPERYRTVAGDIDLYQIHWADGRPMTNHDADTFATMLRAMGIGIEHPAHLRWQPQTAKEKAIYGGIVESHKPGGTPLLRFEPHDPPKRVDNATPITPRGGPKYEVNGPGGTGGDGGGGGGGTGGGGGKKRDDKGTVVDTGTRGTGSRSTRDHDDPVAVKERADRDLADMHARPIDHGTPTRPVGPDLPTTSGQFRQIDPGQYRPLRQLGGSSRPWLVQDAKGQLFVFKPSRNERGVPLAQAVGIEVGTYAVHAKAAQHAADAIGVKTPPVDLVRIGTLEGSLQAFSPLQSLKEMQATNSRGYTDLLADPAFKRARDQIDTLDYLINQVDRNQNIGNYLVEMEGGKFKRLVAIDNELGFGTTIERAANGTYTRGLPATMSSEMLTSLVRLRDGWGAFADSVRLLVGDAALAGVRFRLEQLIAHGQQLQQGGTGGPVAPVGPGGAGPGGTGGSGTGGRP